MIDPKTQRLIEKLIDGSISRKDSELLLNRMETDVSLKREFELRKELETIVAEREYYLLRQKLQLVSAMAANASVGKKQLDGKHCLKRYLYYTAAFTGIAVGGWIPSSLANKDIDPTKLYLKNFKPYPAVRVARSSSKLTSESIFFRAMLSYQNGDYGSAIDSFSKLVERNPNAITIKFYLGITYMELLDFDKARKNLLVVAVSNSLLKERALWYSGLCYLGERNVEKAKSIFSDLSKTCSTLSQKSVELLNEL